MPQVLRDCRRLGSALLSPLSLPGHLNRIGLREVHHELTVDQQQQQRVDTRTKLLESPSDSSFCCQVATGDEKWVLYCNAANRKNVWIKPYTQPTTAKAVAKQDRLVQKVMLCVWWNFIRIINLF